MIEVEHGDPGELISTIHQIMAAALATTEASTGTKTPRRSPRRSTTPSTPATLGRLTLLVHPSKSAIIVVTDDDDELQYVRRLVKEFDVPDQKREGVRIGLVHADAAEMTATIKLVFSPPKGSLEQFRLAADPAGDAIWFTGPQKDLERIRELVETMDRPDQVVSLHIVTLRRQPATLVASILREYESSTAGSAPGRLAEISGLLAQRLSAGLSVAEALAAEETRLPRVYRAVIEAGIKAGRLPQALEAVSRYARTLLDVRRRISLAMRRMLSCCRVRSWLLSLAISGSTSLRGACPPVTLVSVI